MGKKLDPETFEAVNRMMFSSVEGITDLFKQVLNLDVELAMVVKVDQGKGDSEMPCQVCSNMDWQTTKTVLEKTIDEMGVQTPRYMREEREH